MSRPVRLKIAMVVHGRFHAFNVAPELLRLGHDLTLFTNYPASVAARDPLAPAPTRMHSRRRAGCRSRSGPTAGARVGASGPRRGRSGPPCRLSRCESRH